MGATIRRHLPEIVARRVRSRLPPPPPSPPDARTPGSRGANSAFFFEFQVIAADLGRVPKKTRRGRGKAAASVQRIVSRTGFRGPGLGASADSGGRRFGLRNPERSTGSRCAYASRHPSIPELSRVILGTKLLIARRARQPRDVDEGHHSLGRRSSSACAKNAEAFRRISFARLSSPWQKSPFVAAVVRCDTTPLQVVAGYRIQRRPWPEMTERVGALLDEFPGPAVHDATGAGSAIGERGWTVSSSCHKI